MGHMEHTAQAVGHGVAKPQSRLGKGHPCQARRQMHLQTDGGIARVGGWQRRESAAKSLPCQQIRHRSRIPCHIGLQAVGQHIETGFRNQALWQLLEKIAVQNRHVRPQPLIHQRMLDAVVG